MRLGLWLSRKRVRHEAITMTINERVSVNGVELSREPQGRPRLPNIPPATAKVEIAGIQSFSSGVTLYALWPHMHFRGKDMTTRPAIRRFRPAQITAVRNQQG